MFRLRSAYPCSDQSKNTGFVWSPSVGPEELQQGLGVSVKVTVISDHFREPLTFTCDGKTITHTMQTPQVQQHRDLIPILIHTLSECNVCWPQSCPDHCGSSRSGIWDKGSGKRDKGLGKACCWSSLNVITLTSQFNMTDSHSSV